MARRDAAAGEDASSTSSDAIIRLVGLYKSFGSLPVLQGIDLDIHRGCTTAIIGASGSGKTVLIKHIVGLLEPDRGEVWVGDVNMAVATPRQKQEVRKRFGMLFQSGALFDSLTAGENVAFPLRFHTGLGEAERRRLVEEKLELVELPGAFDRPTAELSGGQRKRVGLARAIVLEPEVVIFDEPNSGLDPLTSTHIDALIARMQKHLGITFVVVTHDIVQAVHIADRIAMLDDGRLVACGTVEELLASQDETVRAFLARNVDLPPLEPA